MSKLGISSVLPLAPQFLRELGQMVLNLVRKDADDGKFQNDKSGFSYSPAYAKYKANSMRTLKYKAGTNRAEKLGQYKKGDKKGQTKAGDRLKGYAGKSLNTDVSHVNMRLTGETLNGMGVKSLLPNGFVIAFDPKDAKKIIGNERHGYELVGLSEENQEKIKAEIIKHIDQKFKIQLKDIKITIGR